MTAPLCRIDRRQRERRLPLASETLSVNKVFCSAERRTFKELERRRRIRRAKDVRRALSRLT